MNKMKALLEFDKIVSVTHLHINNPLGKQLTEAKKNW